MATPVKARWWTEGRRFRSLVSAWVGCDAQTCFDYVADFSRHGEWTTGEVRVRPVKPGPVALGARYHAVGVQGGREWPAELVVTVFERPRVFEFTATGGPVPVPDDDPHRHRFTFTAEAEGTRIDQERWDPFAPGWPAWFRYWLIPIVALVAMPVRKKTVANLAGRLQRMPRRPEPERA